MTSPGGRVGRGLVNTAAGLSLLYLFIPIFVIVAFSFNQPKGRFNVVWQHFTLNNWAHPFTNAFGENPDPLTEALKVRWIGPPFFFSFALSYQ